MEPEVAIWIALRDRAAMAAGSLPVLEPANISVMPQDANGSKKPFVALGDVMGATTREFVGIGSWRWSGVLVMTLCLPLGPAYARHKQVAGEIARYFRAGLVLHEGGLCVRITDPASVQSGYQDGGWWRTPIRVQWQCAVSA